ncbi:MAG: ATP-binding cassette domain-containing protein, partial [Verrucomicrobiales bacterium]|nr:ATP-binding cassette domain-containing protein [Verrucomicrobiales bacterium]
MSTSTPTEPEPGTTQATGPTSGSHEGSHSELPDQVRRRLPLGWMDRSRFSFWRRLRQRIMGQQTQRTEHTMLPVLIQVFAGFSKMDGQVDEVEIDSTLGFLRYDYPETVYSELRQLYSRALRKPQNLDKIARDLSARLPLEEKILLGVQLYVLISRADLPKERLITFYQFMTTLGVASEAINIVYQLNTSEISDERPSEEDGEQPLETVLIGRRKPCDVTLQGLSDSQNIAVFRFRDLVLLKNTGTDPVIVRGRRVSEGEFCRVYDAQRILVGEVVLDYQDLIFFFNAKKHVSTAHLFLAQDSNGAHFIEKERSKQSYLEVVAGLGIIVTVLRDVPASIGTVRLRKGATMEVSLRDRIVFDDRTEIAFSELRRRAREMGGRFHLEPSRSEFLVSNNPELLREGDILLSPGVSGEVLLRIQCHYLEKTGELEVLRANQPIVVGGTPVRGKAWLREGETIAIGDGQYLRCHFGDRIIEEERNVISSLSVRDVSHSYDRRATAMDNISIQLQRGEMVCVMGPSGCGKSTLLKCLAGQLRPHEGRVDLNGVDLYANLKDLTPYIAFIPHEDAFDPLLTVEENIDTAAAIRAPHFTRQERRRRADAKLVELGLNEIRHRLAGDGNTKNLSGGQRKRLNAGMDMIGIADIYLFDEPTSGLSSKDSEHVLEIIRGLTHNKITLVSIHQPSSRLFHMFDKALLLDNGGKLAFFGTPSQMLEYFADARRHEGVSPREFHEPVEEAVPSETSVTPDFVFDVLETPLRDLSGDVIYEQDARGQLIPARRFNPSFWRDRFQTHRLLQEVNLRELEPEGSHATKPAIAPARPRRCLHNTWVQFVNLFKRAFLSKLRNRSNFATTLLEAPALAFLVAAVLRYSEDGVYHFANAFHIPTYLFLSLVIALFLGLTNSAEEIIRDRALLERERNHGIGVASYIMSKVIALGFFAFIQCVIYVAIGDAVLSIRSMFWHDLFWMFSTSMVGIGTGLFISSLVSTPKTAVNIIPLIMIPNIILGGALIKYDEMNRGVDILQNLSVWLDPGEESKDESKLKVPLICEIMPLRWSYEALIIAHAERNPATALSNDVNAELEPLKARVRSGAQLSKEEEDRMDMLKDALVTVYSVSAPTPAGVAQKIDRIRSALSLGTFRYEDFAEEENPDANRVTAEQLYLNEKVHDLFNRAEFERQDYRRKGNPPNVFFGKEKQLTLGHPSRLPTGGDSGSLRFRFETLHLNAGVMFLFVLGGLATLYM